MSAVIESAAIIAVGSELLTPHRLDTNSLFLTGRLNDLGIIVRAKRVVPDDERSVHIALLESLEVVDAVVVTGGLGPTADDVTREAVAAALERPLTEDPALVEQLRERFAKRRLPMPANNRRQAQVPRGAVVLHNPHGSAPGLWLESGSQLVVLLPGPPRELEPLFDAEVAPRLSQRTSERRVRRRVVKLTGRPESLVDEVAQPIYGPLGQPPFSIDTTILAAPGQIELHLSAAAATSAVDELDNLLGATVKRLAEALDPFVFSVDGQTLEEVVGRRLLKDGLRIAVAESCTGGLVLGRLTNVPGSSAWVVGGVVAYEDNVKVEQLGVPEALLAEHGAVSEPVALAMASGVRSRLKADVGLAITGIAGPSGGSEAKPVGLVVFAISGPAEIAQTLRFPGDRQMVRQHSVAAALDLVRRTLR